MTDLPLRGRTALVTGAAKRTGRAIARKLAEAGADLVLHYHRSAEQAAQLARELGASGRRVIALGADLSSAQNAERLIEQIDQQLGALDILVNNVGNYPEVAPLAQTADEFAATLATNLIAPYALIRAALPMLRRAPAADVINLGYVGSGHVLANRHAMGYQISKTGLLVLTRTLAQELGPVGVRVNMVSPGHLDNSVDLPARIAAHVPLGRAGSPDEVADCILYLLTRGAYITGANIELAGGYKLGLARRLEDETQRDS